MFLPDLVRHFIKIYRPFLQANRKQEVALITDPRRKKTTTKTERPACDKLNTASGKNKTWHNFNTEEIHQFN